MDGSGLTNDGAVALLSTTAGIAGVVFVVMQAVRKALDPALWDRFAAIIAMALGVVFAFLFAFATVAPLTSTAIVGAIVSGIVGGALSQNVNTAVRRMFPVGS